MKNQQLPNLTPIRFLAALTVICYHIDNALVDNSYKQSNYNFFPFSFGRQAVVLFFVLSGFLITYLLLKEKQVKEISIKNFYIKRALRIWPVYYLVLIIAFWFCNNSPFLFWNEVTNNNINLKNRILPSVVLLGLISPNVVIIYAKSLGYAVHTWSIGVEEQFYLMWPLIIKKKNYLIYIISIILIMYPLSHGIISSLATISRTFTGDSFYFKLLFVNDFFSGWMGFSIDAMAIGALGSHVALNKSYIIPYIFDKRTQIISYLILLSLFFSPQTVDYQFYSVLFIIIILNLALNPKSIFNFNSPYLDYLGKISYGIYMYHLFTVIPSIKIVLDFFKLPINMLSELLMCFISLVTTVLLSSLSYHLLELKFLKLKPKY